MSNFYYNKNDNPNTLIEVLSDFSFKNYQPALSSNDIQQQQKLYKC